MGFKNQLYIKDLIFGYTPFLVFIQHKNAMLILLFKSAEILLYKMVQFLNFRLLVHDLWVFKYTELWLFDLRIWIISLYLTNVENYKSPTISH